MGTVNFRKNDTYRNMYDGFLQIRGHVNAVDDLPVSGISKGDIYTVGDSKSMYIYNESWSPMGGSDGGPVSWNDVTDKPFYTTTYPTIDLPNGIKLVIDGYVKDNAVVNEQYGRYNVGDTRFDIALINKADNTVLEEFVGVVPVLRHKTTSRMNMAVNILFDSVHMTNSDDIDGPLALNMTWSELAAFDEVVRPWAGSIRFLVTEDEPTMIGNVFFVPTPAKPSAVKGQDYDTVTIEDSLEGYTAYYKKADEVKKIDKSYLPNPYATLEINGDPYDGITSSELENIGLSKENVDAVVNGEMRYVIARSQEHEPRLYKVLYAGTDNGVYFICESTEFYSNSISYQRISFGYNILDDGTPELYYYIEKDFSYPINAASEQGD